MTLMIRNFLVRYIDVSWNIAVKDRESCIEYRTPEEVIEVLNDIHINIRKYKNMVC